MIRIASKPKFPTPAWHAALLAMLPVIRRKAQFAFRYLAPEAREEAVQEVIAYAVLAVKTLHDRGTLELAYPSVLAMHGIKRVYIGRRLGAKLNIHDVSSKYCQRQKNVIVEQLDRCDKATGQWQEVLVEDRRAGPAQTAAARIDFSNWLAGMSSRNRRVARALATGERTDNVARRFHLSKGRISQLRSELRRSWSEFHGEEALA